MNPEATLFYFEQKAFVYLIFNVCVSFSNVYPLSSRLHLTDQSHVAATVVQVSL